MALARDVYRALEDIVGPENISEELGVLDSYSHQFAAKVITHDEWMTRPEAVLLPQNTKEVQAIVKACNRWGIRFKALSTGWGPWNSPRAEGCIVLDMRRMNRIIEIDEKNMHAVVEPYVISAELQAELMKRGLSMNIIGAGSSTTALGVAKWAGYGNLGMTHSTDSRSVLAVEWVLPTGDILKLGSLGQDGGWFCGDGPGPSLRGLARGILGAMGGIGVFTKAALKVYHWPGPPIPPVKGATPRYFLDPIPERFSGCMLYFPSYEKMADFVYKVGESEIAYVVFKNAEFAIQHCMTGSNEEAMELKKKIIPPEKLPGFQVVIAADTQAEFGFKEKVLKQIMEETGAKSLVFAEEDPYVQAAGLWWSIRQGVIARVVFRPVGTMSSTFGTLDTPDLAVNQAKTGLKLIDDFIKKGELGEVCRDITWGVAYEGSHLAHIEVPVECNPGPEDRGVRHFVRAADEAVFNPPEGTHMTGFTLGTFSDVQNRRYGPKMGNFHTWMVKMKKAFDPNGAADSYWYIVGEE